MGIQPLTKVGETGGGKRKDRGKAALRIQNNETKKQEYGKHRKQRRPG